MGSVFMYILVAVLAVWSINITLPVTNLPNEDTYEFDFFDSVLLSDTDRVNSVGIMASHKIPIPIYNPDKSYEIYKSELELWKAVTELKPEKQAAAIVLTLPNSDKCNIRATILERVPHSKLILASGLTDVQTALDEILGKDDIEDCWSKYEEFEDFNRTTETIEEYIRQFETRYNRIKNKSIALPEEILAFALLRKAKISREDKKLVLTGLDYTKKTDLFAQAKKSLKKYCGGGSSCSGAGNDSIKFQASDTKPEVFANYPYHGTTPRGYARRGYSSSRGPAPRGRGQTFWPHQAAPSRGSTGNWRGSGRGERPLNPPGVDGRPLLCKGCGSYRHYLRSCPESWESMKQGVNNVNYTDNSGACSEEYYYDEEQCYEDSHYEPSQYEQSYNPHVTLFTGHDPTTLSTFAAEAQNCAVLDTACCSTVCGVDWFETFSDQLDSDSITQVGPEGGSHFKFGAGPVLETLGTYEIPVIIAGVSVRLRTDVVQSDIPLLLSKSAMKKAGIIIDMNNDSAVIFGQSVPLNTTSSGHYCIPLREVFPVNEVSVLICGTDSGPGNVGKTLISEDLDKSILKLHRQFGHPSEVKLISLLKDAGVWEESYRDNVKAVYSKCRASGVCRFKQKVIKPVVALPLATDFNDKIALDLKQWKGKWILHMVDLFSRFTVSAFISRKRPTDVIHAMLSDWCSVFGVPNAILTDNGGEFINAEMLEVESMLNIQVLTTAAQSPWSNGTCERNHQIVDSILSKLTHDFPGTPENVLLKWACSAKNSMQMVEGFSPYQLVIGRNPNLPGITNSTPSTLETSSMSEAFTRHMNGLHAARKAFTESESCERIKRALKHRVRTSEQVFMPGDKVYYKRDQQERWLGPAKVIFQDGKVVFVRHGAVWVRVSPNRLVKSGREFVPSSDTINSNNANDETETDSDTDSVENTTHADTNTVERNTHADTNAVERNQNIPIDPYSDTPNLEPLFQNDIHINPHADAANPAPENGAAVHSDEVPVQRSSLRLLNKQFGWNVYDVQVNDVPRTLQKSPQCIQAKQDELDKLKLFDVYEEVEDQGQTCIDTKWVITYKGSGVKARIVARGFQEADKVPADSPTVAKVAFRCVLSLAASRDWKVVTTDIKSAFLQGKELDRDVFLRPPKEAQSEGSIWRLRKCLYGLNDGARQFYLSLKQKLLELGCSVSSVDPSLFFLERQGVLHGVLVSHIDDFLHAGDSEFEKCVMEPLRKRFIAGKVEEQRFRYIGFDVNQTAEGIKISMDDYVEKRSTFQPIKPGEQDRELSKEEKKEFRSVVGMLNWVAQGTRPDRSFEVIELSTKFKAATLKDLGRAKKMFLKLREHGNVVNFSRLDKESGLNLLVFTDAAHANLPDGVSSTSGILVFIADGRGNINPVSWRAHKIWRVVRSSLAAETLAFQEGLAEAIYVKKLLSELDPVSEFPISAYVDNKSLYDALNSTKLVEDRRLRIEMGEIKQILEQEVSSIQWISGTEMIANSLTKRGADGSALLAIFQNGRVVV